MLELLSILGLSVIVFIMVIPSDNNQDTDSFVIIDKKEK